jgi:hypothetical protein
MPTRKQRRREQKARRHEYEYVYVDDAGNEVDVEPDELRAQKEARRETRGSKVESRKPAAARGQRAVQPPSWRRAARRGVVLGPLLIVAMMLFNRGVPLVQQIAPAAFLLVFFIPFSYFTDSFAYRMYRKRLERRETASRS